MLKRAILHRKNSMFYKTGNGAEVGDIYMSLIHTCGLCRVNPFEYLQALQIHAQDVQAKAALWLPGITASNCPAPRERLPAQALRRQAQTTPRRRCRGVRGIAPHEQHLQFAGLERLGRLRRVGPKGEPPGR